MTSCLPCQAERVHNLSPRGFRVEARRLSPEGLALVKRFEGLCLSAYRDAVGVWTIGYGSTRGVQGGMVITEVEAEARLRRDLEEAEQWVELLCEVPLTQGQFDAMVSFTFNLGPGALGKSTLLKKVNAGDYAGASFEFGRWVKAGGEVLPGLVRRRAAERALFDRKREAAAV